MTNTDLAELLMDILEHRYCESTIRHDKRARPIAFDLLDAGTYTFDPRSRGRLFAQRKSAEAALRLTCTANDLLSFILDPQTHPLTPTNMRYLGDLGALDALIAAAAPTLSPLGLRCASSAGAAS